MHKSLNFTLSPNTNYFNSSIRELTVLISSFSSRTNQRGTLSKIISSQEQSPHFFVHRFVFSCNLLVKLTKEYSLILLFESLQFNFLNFKLLQKRHCINKHYA